MPPLRRQPAQLLKATRLCRQHTAQIPAVMPSIPRVQSDGSTKHGRPSGLVLLPRDTSGHTLMERVNGSLGPLALRESNKGDRGRTLEERINGPLESLGSKKPSNKRPKKPSSQSKYSINRKQGQQKSMTLSATQVYNTSFTQHPPLPRSTTFTVTKKTQKRGHDKRRKVVLMSSYTCG